MFWSMRRLLLNYKIAVKRRLRLFDSTVTSCVLWCTESWTPRAGELKQLEVTQRAMLRKIAGGARRPEEEWLDWIRRVTKKALQLASEVEVRSWASTHNKRKWMWSGHVARRHGYELTWRVTFWRGSSWQAAAQEMGNLRPVRPSRRRWMKYEDIVRRFCSEHGIRAWDELAQDRTAWLELETDFVKWSAKSLKKSRDDEG